MPVESDKGLAALAAGTWSGADFVSAQAPSTRDAKRDSLTTR